MPAPRATGTSGDDDLLDRLRRMGSLHGRESSAVTPRTATARVADSELAARVGGEQLRPGLIRLCSSHPLPSGWGHDEIDMPGHPSHSAPGLVFLDTETTGLAGGSGTLAFLVGMLCCRADRLELTQYLITRYDAEAAMLDVATAALDGSARAWVTYNGKSYDLPLLDTRMRMQGRSAWPALDDHLDLVHGVRRGFGDRWPDCRLTTAESRLLGIERQDDLPGAEAPEAWFRYLRHGDASRLVKVIEHNRQDLLSLAGLLPAISAIHRVPARYHANALAIARHAYRHGADPRVLVGMLKPASEQLDPEGLLELAAWARRAGDWAYAVEIWEALADANHQRAIEALAKYHEHTRRDFRRALELASRLQPAASHQARITRLRQKLAATRPI